MSTSSKPDLSRVVRAEIHPAIGVGRVGNAEEEYTLTPQVPNPASMPAGSYRDSTGAIKREGVEFRIFGYDAEGAVVAELTAGNAKIDWTVQLANLKAAWYEFSVALDIPQAKNEKMPRRNPNTVDPAAREKLAIIASPQTLSDANGKACFDDGTFMDETVYLGEMRTDADNRLLVLGGHGAANSPTGMPAFNPAQDNGFGNAIGWHDDVSDGPVDAEVTIDGRSIPVEGAWVAFGPPKFAPDVIGWRTMYELLEQMFQDNNMIEGRKEVSFTLDVYPILQRMTGLQWVNSGFAAMFGANGPLNFEDPKLIDKLCRIHGDRDAFGGLRREIYNTFRPAKKNPGANPRTWPWIYGDAYGSFEDDPSAPVSLPLPDLFRGILKAWAAGKFVADWGTLPAPPSSLEEVPLADQPATMTKASLHFCAADAFHPGIELTWPMRHVSMYQAPFRIRRNAPGVPTKLDYGTLLTQEIATAFDGPLNGQGPGGLTRWMLLPWQVDTAGCRSGYDDAYDPTVPTFWPAHVPNQVLTEADYKTLMDSSLKDDERRNAFNNRVSWYDSMPTDNGREQLTVMVHFFGQMGIVEAMPGPKDLEGVPDIVYVDRLPQKLEKAAAFATMSVAATAEDADTDAAALRQSGFGSEKERADLRKLRFGSLS